MFRDRISGRPASVQDQMTRLMRDIEIPARRALFREVKEDHAELTKTRKGIDLFRLSDVRHNHDSRMFQRSTNVSNGPVQGQPPMYSASIRRALNFHIPF